jgi:hypothetical protein
MELELSEQESELLLELIDGEMSRIRESESNKKRSDFSEQLYQREDILTRLIQKLSREGKDLKEPVREDHRVLEKKDPILTPE